MSLRPELLQIRKQAGGSMVRPNPATKNNGPDFVTCSGVVNGVAFEMKTRDSPRDGGQSPNEPYSVWAYTSCLITIDKSSCVDGPATILIVFALLSGLALILSQDDRLRSLELTTETTGFYGRYVHILFMAKHRYGGHSSICNLRMFRAARNSAGAYEKLDAAEEPFGG